VKEILFRFDQSFTSYHDQLRWREVSMHAPSGASSFYGGESLHPSQPYKPTPSYMGWHA
jgi:hypothetical protein